MIFESCCYILFTTNYIGDVSEDLQLEYVPCVSHYIFENIDLKMIFSVNEIIFSYLSHGNVFTHCISELDSYLCYLLGVSYPWCHRSTNGVHPGQVASLSQIMYL